MASPTTIETTTGSTGTLSENSPQLNQDSRTQWNNNETHTYTTIIVGNDII